MKKIVSKVVATALAGVLSLSVLTACGNSSQTDPGQTTTGGSGDQVSISFGIWDEKQRPAMEQMVAGYQTEHPNVKVEIC